MSQLKFQSVVTFSSEDGPNLADNILSSDRHKAWKGVAGASSHTIEIDLDRASIVQSVVIGNAGSAMIELQVARRGELAANPGAFYDLLPTSTFMTKADMTQGTNATRIRTFTKEACEQDTVSQRWDRIRLVCRQPFSKTLPFGVAFVELFGLSPTGAAPPPSGGNRANAGAMAMVTETQPVNDDDADGSHSGGERTSPTVSPPAAAMKPAVTQFGAFKLKSEAPKAAITPGSLFHESRNTISAMPAKAPSSFAPTQTTKAAASVAPAKQAVPASQSSRSSAPVALPSSAASSQPLAAQTVIPPPSSSSSATARPTQLPAAKPAAPVIARAEKPSAAAPVARAEKASETHTPPKTLSPARKPMVHSDESGDEDDDGFKLLMKGVTFVLSGYQNPLRGELRTKGQQMGARYEQNWTKGCTHLICAFANTPKYREVQGKGKIVNERWLTDSHKHRRLMNWRKYTYEPVTDESDQEQEQPPPPRTPSPNKPPSSHSASLPHTPKQQQPTAASPPLRQTPPSAAKRRAVASDTDEDEQSPLRQRPLPAPQPSSVHASKRARLEVDESNEVSPRARLDFGADKPSTSSTSQNVVARAAARSQKSTRPEYDADTDDDEEARAPRSSEWSNPARTVAGTKNTPVLSELVEGTEYRIQPATGPAAAAAAAVAERAHEARSSSAPAARSQPAPAMRTAYTMDMDTDDELDAVANPAALPRPAANRAPPPPGRALTFADQDTEDEDEAATHPSASKPIAQPPAPELPDFFEGLVFHLDKSVVMPARAMAKRYIAAYGGTLDEDTTEVCTHFIAENHSRDIAATQKDHPRMVFVKSGWLSACHLAKRRVPIDDFKVPMPSYNPYDDEEEY
ncbi:hypothetical protein CAOG_07862 [Capsaspora owczarzaki ATCC 30864]|uniref:BRCT domain-containing protein n=1 Tax=Capsaspora owczarzaki (strain ATCC 30864) TaxID=595528 RepID=A0A0D2X5G3_CAPO3|nr:hypothetical protein CAOG_07862 [Capsaspora owczarzaki ATCC 30864]KJE97759.1 hypothetical protein CAOG_007862 [Capsaspora owczarzaki ATCC 30864]|eukprot:XP_004342947.2 hypothetical protein CAOG_07862 [Capsaspora owczarzaki ATCC 30864]